jgi:hypothetical protein
MSKANGSRNRAAQLAAQFKQQTEKAFEQNWRKEVSMPIPTIAPGFVFTFIAQRVDITSLLYNGQLPETFAKQILANRREASREEIAEDFLNEASAEEKKASLDFQVKIAQEVCYAPKLVFHDPENEEEIDLRKLPFSGNLIIALFNYAMGLSPDVPVATTDGGQTSLKAVETFPEGLQRGELPGAGPDSPEPGAGRKRAAQDR